MDKSPFDRRIYTIASTMLIVLVAGLGAWLAMEGQWLEAGSLAGTVLLGLFFMFAHDRLPAIFTLLFLIAGAVNAAGYIFTLWYDPDWFDEVAHAYTSFTGCAAIGWLMLGGRLVSARAHAIRYVLAVTAIGLVLGVAWEGFEWAIGIINGWTDTIMDLVMDMIGAVAAGLFCAWAAKRLRRASISPRKTAPESVF